MLYYILHHKGSTYLFFLKHIFSINCTPRKLVKTSLPYGRAPKSSNSWDKRHHLCFITQKPGAGGGAGQKKHIFQQKSYISILFQKYWQEKLAGKSRFCAFCYYWNEIDFSFNIQSHETNQKQAGCQILTLDAVSHISNSKRSKKKPRKL